MPEPAQAASLQTPLRISREHGLELASWFAIAICVSAAIGLRFYAIDRLPGINGDEPQYAVHAHEFFAGTQLTALRTGSDLPMNPLFFGTVLVLQKLLPATLWTLRFSAVLLSLLTIALAWALFRPRGATFAATFACLVAVLPIHLGYARFAWDPTAIPTASVLAVAASARGCPGLCLAAFLLCLWVHPTTVFLAPCLVTPFLTRCWPRDSSGRWRWSRRRMVGASLLALSLPLAAAAVLYVGLTRDWLPSAVSDVLRGDLLENAWQRARDPGQLGRFLLAYVELLSGPTIYRYIIGSLSAWVAQAHVWSACALALPLLAAGMLAARRRGRARDLAFAVGLLLSLLLLYLLAGPVALAAKTERYAVCLTVPACYVLSACVDALSTPAARARVLRLAVAFTAGALLFSFSTHYLRALKHRDAEREDTFRTGAVEPKALALQTIAQLRDPTKLAVIYTEDWWIYWTLRYLAPPSAEPPTRVTIYHHPWDYRFPEDFTPPAYDEARMQLFGVAWADHKLAATFAKLASETRAILGYEPGPILQVYKLRSLPRHARSRRRSP